MTKEFGCRWKHRLESRVLAQRTAYVTADSGRTMLSAGSPIARKYLSRAIGVVASGLYKDQRAHEIRRAAECIGLTLGKEHDVTGPISRVLPWRQPMDLQFRGRLVELSMSYHPAELAPWQKPRLHVECCARHALVFCDRRLKTCLPVVVAPIACLPDLPSP